MNDAHRHSEHEAAQGWRAHGLALGLGGQATGGGAALTGDASDDRHGAGLGGRHTRVGVDGAGGAQLVAVLVAEVAAGACRWSVHCLGGALEATGAGLAGAGAGGAGKGAGQTGAAGAAARGGKEAGVAGAAGGGLGAGEGASGAGLAGLGAGGVGVLAWSAGIA